MANQNMINVGTNAPPGWTPYTATLTSTGVNPTPGAGTVINAHYKQHGKLLHFMLYFQQTVAGANGTGIYLFDIPAIFAVDTTAFALDPGGGPGGLYPIGTVAGHGFAVHNNVARDDGPVTFLDATHFKMAPGNIYLRFDFFGINVANTRYTYKGTVPIV